MSARSSGDRIVCSPEEQEEPQHEGSAGDGDGAACARDEGPGLRAAAAAKDGTAVLAVGATRACEATLAIFG